jgi:poly(hydroxyalkanoate) depolymerase family esterase
MDPLPPEVVSADAPPPAILSEPPQTVELPFSERGEPLHRASARDVDAAAATVERRASQFLSRSFSSAEGSRAYKLYIPAGYHEQSSALVVMLHGCTQSADDFAAGTRMNELADEYGFLVAYPIQPASANPSKCWNWFARGDQQRDRGEPSLVAGIVLQIALDYAIDPKRFYAAGLSAGGAAAAVLGVTYPEMFAAIGVHSGIACGLAHDAGSAFAVMRGGDGDARPTEPQSPSAQPRVPTITFQGDRDTTVNLRNGERFAVASLIADCAVQTETGEAAGREYTRTRYTDATARAMLEQWLIRGGKHAWSGGSALGSYADPHGPNASREMIRFFFSHTALG